MRTQVIEKKPETPIEAIISAYEGAIGKYNATSVRDMQNPTMIEKVYEIPGQGGIIAHFVPTGGPRFTINTQNQASSLGDGVVMYLGFDESAQKYKSMISDVLQALDGK